jgi:DICT domain-containing protein
LYHFPIADQANGDLSTAQLASRTGLTAGTLRMWETRYGFPASPRQPGRHRRYTERDVDLILEVLGLRAQGFSLTAAIERARHNSRPRPRSLFAELRRRHPEIQPAAMSKLALLRLTRAIEDEYCASGASGLLLASFQRERFYRQSERRWRELARGADLAVAMADFARLAETEGAPSEVPVKPAQPLAREWTLVVDSPTAHACLAGWERADPGERADSERSFEVLWSFDPQVVRSASRIAVELVGGPAPAVAGRLERALTMEPAAVGRSALGFANSLSNRVVAYLAAGGLGPAGGLGAAGGLGLAGGLGPAAGPSPADGPRAR